MLLHGRAVPIICASIVLAALAAGCGGGAKATGTASRASSSVASGAGSDTNAPPNAGPKATFIVRAEGICRHTNAQLANTKPKGASPEQVAAAVIQNETIERKANGLLAKLSPPGSLAANWRKMLGYRRSLANQLGSLAAAARNHAATSVKLLGQSKKRLHGQLRRLAASAGFKDCAKVGSR
jgi:hypothetical protein